MNKAFSGYVLRCSVNRVDQFTIYPEGLDPVRVITENGDDGNQGMVTITCYGRAWTAYWGAMSSRSVREFFVSCDADYLVGCLVRGMTPTAKRFVASDEAYLARIVEAVKQAFRNTRQVVGGVGVPDADPTPTDASLRATALYYVLPRESGHSMVKEGDFFRWQGGLKDDWGKHWIPMCADSIDDARRLADRMVNKQQSPIWNSDAPGGNP